jgi:hypothetical protein
MRKILLGSCILLTIFILSGWGFYGHRQINRMAVFTLPAEMIVFYKKNLHYITEASVNADRRRFLVVGEAPRHYIDIDRYGDSAVFKLPRSWTQAVARYPEDTLKRHGILPWHVVSVYYSLRDAFLVGDPDKILRLSADLGHYIADAHVPLHTTKNYNGQYTGQEGIHAFWESRVPELFANEYNFFVDKAEYVSNPQQAIWRAIVRSHLALDTVLSEERSLSEKFRERKYAFETKGRQTVKVYSREFSDAYHRRLNGMVERQMRAAVKMIGNFWYSAWLDAGQPDLKKFLSYKPTPEEIRTRAGQIEKLKEKQLRVHE